MENPSTHSLLGVTRQQSEDGGSSKFLPAGPSRLPLNLNDDLGKIDDEGDLDAQSTPKITLITSVPDAYSPPGVSPVDTPAARLRALLRAPNNSASKLSSQDRRPAPPSEVESDFDPPQFSPATPSFARESLKDLFSRALRDPGDTPQKGRQRRNSIDISEVEASPRVERERAKNKGKRRSLSDEESEKPSSRCQLEIYLFFTSDILPQEHLSDLEPPPACHGRLLMTPCGSSLKILSLVPKTPLILYSTINVSSLLSI